MRSMMRSTAEAHGKRWVESDSAYLWWRDPLIAEAMVDPRITVPDLSTVRKYSLSHLMKPSNGDMPMGQLHP